MLHAEWQKTKEGQQELLRCWLLSLDYSLLLSKSPTWTSYVDFCEALNFKTVHKKPEQYKHPKVSKEEKKLWLADMDKE